MRLVCRWHDQPGSEKFILPAEEVRTDDGYTLEERGGLIWATKWERDGLIQRKVGYPITRHSTLLWGGSVVVVVEFILDVVSSA